MNGNSGIVIYWYCNKYCDIENAGNKECKEYCGIKKKQTCLT